MGALAVGIDLGTTNSCVGVYKDEKVQIIQNEHYSNVLPSWVSFTDEGVLTGHEAKDEAHLHIKNTVFEAKRLIGQSYDDEKIQKYIGSLPYEVVSDEGLLKIKVESKGKSELYFPEVISSYILQKLKLLAESYLDQTVAKVVVTVPAYFNEIQREATKMAAQIAGFKKDNIDIINEPTAAALAFSYQNVKRYKRNVLVYDFGGGTFDVSIVTLNRGECIVKATKGDLHLGGTDIDTNIVNYIKEDFKEQFGEEIADNEEETRRLKNACEQIKIKLSGETLTREIDLSDLSGNDYLSSITRQKFEELNAELFEKTLSIVENCMDNSGLSKDDIDEVVLVGGSSKIPKIQQMLIEYFGNDKINRGVNPDEAVAYGAALHATNLVGNKSVVKDVISLSLGIAINNYFSPYWLSSVIIPCNTSIPETFTKTYQTIIDDQEAAMILVFQGEELLAKDNIELGSFNLTGLRRAPAGEVKVAVCFEVDSEGILKVTASEIGAENQDSIKIDVKKKGLTYEQCQQRTIELEEHRQNDLNRRNFHDKKYRLERLCHHVCNNVENISDSEFRTEIFGKCVDICEWLKNISIDDQDEVEDKRKEIEDACASNGIVIQDSLPNICG